MTPIIESITGEYRRYKALAERALAQVPEEALSAPGPGGTNSFAIICWHVSGNLRSRFTDFLTTDGEKPWRRRDEEFDARQVTRDELQAKWELGWAVLFDTLAGLRDEQLGQTIAIRGQTLRVDEALHRSLAHTSYHVGQIVLLARIVQGAHWQWLSIPPGQSETYRPDPTPAGPGGPDGGAPGRGPAGSTRA